ncbi:TRL domain-containing protein [Helicobacter aurati]|uniref:TRL domain-containing protein n=1 Tax=Helicobacter aurati TaxID=137778 RepID=UPI00131571F8|nr:TRL domain-containing protein [Helicobacter aurati]
MKQSKAACRSIFFIPVSFGKCTIGKAAENGGLKQIQSVDYKYFNILIYSSKTVEVRGK